METGIDGADLWIFLHLPKTGGTTVNGHFARHLEFGETLVQLSRWGDARRERLGLPPFESWPEERRHGVRVLSGHRTYYGIHRLVPGRTPRYLTIVRDPAERIVSRYNFNRSRGQTDLDFEAWYDRTYLPSFRNNMVAYYAERLTRLPCPDDPLERLRLAGMLLDQCWFVGITDRLDADLPALFAAMGLPTTWQNYRVTGGGTPLTDLPLHPSRREVVRRYVEIDEALRARLHADNHADLALFQHAVRVRAARLSSGGLEARRTDA